MGRTASSWGRGRWPAFLPMAAASLGSLVIGACPCGGESPPTPPTSPPAKVGNAPPSDSTVERALGHSGVLEARLVIERSVSSLDSRDFARAASRLHGLSRSAAAQLARTLPHRTTVSGLLEAVIEALRTRQVGLMRGGHNELLSDALAERRFHPGTTQGPRAFWVDCDLLATGVWAVLEELEQRRSLPVMERLVVVATSDHLTLGVRAHGSRNPVSTGRGSDEEVSVAVLDRDRSSGRLEVKLVPLSAYRASYRRRSGETPRILEPRTALIANAWEIAASRLLLGRRDELALRYAERALELDPSSVGAWNSLALAQNRLGEPAQALGSLRRAIRLRAGDPHLFANLASVYLALGQRDRALRAAESAVLHGPDEPLVYRRRFSVLALLGRGDTARRDLGTYQALLGEKPPPGLASSP